MIIAFIALASTLYAVPPRLQAANVAEAFKSECISDAGVAVGVQNWTDWMKFFDTHRATAQAVQKGLIDATKAVPFDIDQYAKALKASNDDQHYLLGVHNDYDIKLLSDLPPADRTRWVFRLARGTPSSNQCETR